MDKLFLKTLLTRLSRHAFETFIREMYQSRDTAETGFNPITEAGEGVYYRELIDSYGGSLHNVYFLHYLPHDLFPEHNINFKNEPTLVQNIKNIHKIYKGQKGYWGMVDEHLELDNKLQSVAFITNLSGIEKETYENKIIPQYSDLAINLGMKKPTFHVGSFDSFIDLSYEETEDTFMNFVISNSEGIRISLEQDNVSVDYFFSEKNLASGVLPHSKSPCEPVFINYIKQKESIVEEFESLIRKDVSENDLENFLVANFKEIFGSHYDRVETQLWLRFPELDITGHNRRMDIFLRNSVINDWELFEVKRVIPTTSKYRDIPVLSKEISYAIHQVKNYSHILSQDSVKKHFAKEGIEYYEPSLNIVVGRTPQILHNQWRWLLANNKEVRILTFDHLLNEMKVRLQDQYKIYKR